MGSHARLSATKPVMRPFHRGGPHQEFRITKPCYGLPILAAAAL